ncbi:MAG: S26 family signal peptidase [Euryarchaeota archaeon]|nr:S26 family signal peptidase [Euryarchaeota archaeon]
MGLKDTINTFRHSDNFWISLSRDVAFVMLAVAAFAVVSQIIFGMWTPMVAVESGSMQPHMEIGDIVFVESIDRTEIITYEAATTNQISFEEPGNVILYRPYGQEGVTPIIHRAMYHVETGESMWPGGPAAPYNGYITKGDNPITNKYYDQQGQISYLLPVKEEWIIGVAKYRIPYVGHVRLLFS